MILTGVCGDQDPNNANALEYGLSITGGIFMLLLIAFLPLYLVFNSKANKLGKKRESLEKVDISVEEINKYKKLLDQGIITKEEFDAKRKKILDI
jgi:uncharacterized membrane protein